MVRTLAAVRICSHSVGEIRMAHEREPDGRTNHTLNKLGHGKPPRDLSATSPAMHQVKVTLDLLRAHVMTCSEALPAKHFKGSAKVVSKFQTKLSRIYRMAL